MSIFGFNIDAPSSGSGDWLPIVQYDARAGRLFRTDRTQDTAGNWSAVKEDITNSFKAVVDFENIESGWIDYATGGAPSFVMVKRGNILPAQPNENHKHGVRFRLKLGKDCGGDRPVRELSGNSRAFLTGAQPVVEQYLREAKDHPGLLPVLVLEKTTPVKSGSGDKSSTNYHPTWKIVGWVPRPADLVPPVFPQEAAQTNGSGQQQSTAAPSTGSQRPAQPQQPASQTVSPDDFG